MTPTATARCVVLYCNLIVVLLVLSTRGGGGGAAVLAVRGLALSARPRCRAEALGHGTASSATAEEQSRRLRLSKSLQPGLGCCSVACSLWACGEFAAAHVLAASGENCQPAPGRRHHQPSAQPCREAATNNTVVRERERERGQLPSDCPSSMLDDCPCWRPHSAESGLQRVR